MGSPARSWSSSCRWRLAPIASTVTVPMTAPTTASSATADTTSRVRSDQGRRNLPTRRYSPGLIRYPAPRRVWIIGERPASIFRRR